MNADRHRTLVGAARKEACKQLKIAHAKYSAARNEAEQLRALHMLIIATRTATTRAVEEHNRGVIGAALTALGAGEEADWPQTTGEHEAPVSGQNGGAGE